MGEMVDLTGLTTLKAEAVRWCDGAAGLATPVTSWLWDGYLARGNVTLLTSQPKAGKTTLLSVLLTRLRTGGLLAGRRLRAGKAVVVSEEAAGLWEARRQALGLGPHVCCICRPFPGKPRWDEWRGMVADLGRLHAAHAFDLLAIDTLATFLPAGCENNADRLVQALLALRPLTDAGMSVLLNHHPPKGPTADGQAARGTGAFGGHCDILIEMKHYTTASDHDRRRRLFGYARFEETPRQLVIELNAEGTDYAAQGDTEAAEFAQHWQPLREVLERAEDRLTRRQVLAQWPEAYPPPNARSLLRWLDRAVGLGLIRRRGAGFNRDPYRYWLPGREAAWASDPVWRMKESRRETRREVEGEIRARLEALYGPPPEKPEGG